MNVTVPPFRGDTSPETSPDCKEPDRGRRAVSEYPERGSNPHPAKQEGILSSFSGTSVPVPIDPNRGGIGQAVRPDSSATIPNIDQQPPDVSPDVVARIRRRIVVSDGGCWLWQGSRNATGYGLIRYRGAAHGPIPIGLFVCHSCDTPACCNPEHLWVGSAKDNSVDMATKKRHPLHTKTACVRGHDFVAGSYYVSNGRRHCYACAKVRAAKARERAA